jgi:hypothetical protein
MQIRPVQGQTGADPTPHLGHVDLEQRPAAMIAEALVTDSRGPLGHRVRQTHRPQGLGRVAREVYAGARGGPGGLALDHVEGESMAA